MKTVFEANRLANYLEFVLQAYQEKEWVKQKEAALPKIEVSQTLSSLALIYEKIRTAVDFRAEHLFRRVAIERILRRRLFANKGGRGLAQGLVKELIWGRYLPNNAVPAKKIELIDQIIKKHLRLREKVIGSTNGVFDHQAEVFLGLLATEIDELLVDQREDEAWATALVQWFQQRFDWLDQLTNEERGVLIYIAVRQAFLKSDEAIIRYHLLKHYFPSWSNADDETIDQIADHFHSWQEKTNFYLSHPAGNRLFRYIQSQITPLFVLREIIENNWLEINSLLQNEEKLTSQIKEVCLRRYYQIGQKIRRGIIRSIIYIFATKMLFAFFLEVPYEIWVLGRIPWLPLGINLIFPPALMFFIGLLIRPPGEENTKRIIEGVKHFLFPLPEEEKSPFQIMNQKKGKFASVFKLLYLLLFLISFGGVSWLLWRLGFNLLGGIIFFFFVSLVLLFGFRVRWAANELRVTPEKEGLVESLINLISLPFLDLGVRLSLGLSKLNVLMFVLDFLIEAPLKIIIDVIGEWTTFIRQKRAEVVEVPL